VALLGPSNQDYFFTLLALSRLGFTVLFLSTRISEAAYLSLLNATRCQHIVVDALFRKTAKALASVRHDLEVVDIISQDWNMVRQPAGDTREASELEPELDLDAESTKVAWIIHSSGSTGLPKPIYQTHKAALRNYENSLRMRGFVTLPLFHAFGLSNVFRGITAVKKIYMYNASLPLTSRTLLKILTDHEFEIFLAVPYALKLLSETQEGIAALAALKVVMFGGSACPDALGDLLTEGGVNLISHYGTTETGQLMTSFRPVGDKAWNYVREHERLEPYLRMEPKGGNLYELCVLQGWPSKVATNRDDGSYATKDLFEPHPSIQGAWKYSGRLDDTIVLVNGEKAIPIAMEQALRQNKLVREAVMFGAGKSQLGMMIIAAEPVADMQAEELIDAIWPTVVAENKPLPAYAQLSRDMIRVLPADTAYPSTDKGSLMRQAFYRTFEKEIEEVYRQEESKLGGTLVLSEPELRDFLRVQLLDTCSQDDDSILTDDTDLFSLGVDSLQSTRLRAKILKEIQLNGNTLPPNVVFEFPSIAKLAAAIVNIRGRKSVEVADAIEEMKQLVAKYSIFPPHVPVPRKSPDNCVVVTGATGSLGAHLVAQLVVREDISEVCCLVRASSGTSARHRVIKSMRDRAVYHAIPLEARRKITCYASDFSKQDLGLGNALYATIAEKITSLVHCAWSVNFNKNLSSFEADCIAGARNLMLLCLAAKQTTPASFNFCSSVSTVASTPGDSVPEALPESFKCAQGMGYAQSKLVTEHLVTQAAAKTGMQARVLRVGQIVADTQHGIWNDTEAIPLMLQAATTIGALPALDESARWLPVDNVATTVMEISLSDTTQSVFNVVNPRPFHWTNDLLPALRCAGLSFAQVSQREWIRRLHASNPDPELNPTIKLIEFFARKYDNDITKRRNLHYVTTAAENISPGLGTVTALSQELVQKFVQHFLRTSWAPKCSGALSIHNPPSRLIVLSGPCGVGKSTLASRLAESLACPVIEGDAIHDAIAIAKMSQGIPLTSLDRQIWLSRIKVNVLERIRARQLVRGQQAQATGGSTGDIILTCSALARSHRTALRDILSMTDTTVNESGVGSIKTVFVALQAGENELVKRVAGRKGHYMKADMVRSQLHTTERPEVDEVDVLPVDAEQEMDLVFEEVVFGLKGM
jgi:carbohydrate kinase (thermoresistant glucokinase family)